MKSCAQNLRGLRAASIAICDGIFLLAFSGSLFFADPLHAQDVGPPVSNAQSLPPIPLPTSQQEKERAVALARQGKYDEALNILIPLHQQHKEDADIARDTLAVLGWAGRDREAVDLFETLPADEPDYVLAAAGHSYRQLHQNDKAYAVYSQGHEKYPENPSFAEGEIRCLADAGETKTAEIKIAAYIGKYGTDSKILAIEAEFAKAKEVVRQKIEAERRSAAEKIKAKDESDHEQITTLARAQRYDEALILLQALSARRPYDLTLVRDHLAILDWQGAQDAKVVALYQSLPHDDEPDYVLAAAAHAYRNLHQTDKALALYRQGHKHFWNQDTFILGIMRCLTDKGLFDQAMAEANTDLDSHGDRLDVLLAAGDAAEQKHPFEALRYYQRAARLDSKNTNALQGIVRNASTMGATLPALSIAHQNNGLLSASAQRRLEGDQAAGLVRYGTLEPETEETRFQRTDLAIAHLDNLIALWSHQGNEAKVNILRARYDRIIALRNRGMIKQAVNEYDRLVSEGTAPPPYVMGAVGDAHLGLRHPELARDMFIDALKKMPHDYELQRQLYYAYSESFEFYNAYRTSDALALDQPIWFHYTGDPVPRPNNDRFAAELLTGNARLASGEVAKADTLTRDQANRAAGAVDSRSALGDLDFAQGWPRQALEQYEIGVALNNGKDVDNEIGIANSDLELQDYPEAEKVTNSLVRRFPENTNVQHTDRVLSVHNMAVLNVEAGYEFDPMTTANVVGGEGYDVDTSIYSSPLNYNWRIFAGEYFAHQEEPTDEGSVGLTSSRIGVEYRNGPFTGSVAPTYNRYHSSERLGTIVTAASEIGDQWTVAGDGEVLARETPLRALNSGVTSDLASITATWRENEAREVHFGGSLMPFSDGNFRSQLNADYTQSLWTTPYIKLDGLSELSEQQNTDNEDRTYYNPSRDALGLVGLRATEALYQHYSTLFEHSLTVTPGAYWEQHFGYDATLRMQYAQDLILDDLFEAGWKVNFLRQDYDGVPENDVSITFNLTRRL